MIEHSISYVRDNLERIIAAGLPVRITRYGMTVGYYNPEKVLKDGKWETIEKKPFSPATRPSSLSPEERPFEQEW